MKINWAPLAALAGATALIAAVSTMLHRPVWWGFIAGGAVGAVFTLSGHSLVRRS